MTDTLVPPARLPVGLDRFHGLDVLPGSRRRELLRSIDAAVQASPDLEEFAAGAYAECADDIDLVTSEGRARLELILTVQRPRDLERVEDLIRDVARQCQDSPRDRLGRLAQLGVAWFDYRDRRFDAAAATLRRLLSPGGEGPSRLHVLAALRLSHVYRATERDIEALILARHAGTLAATLELPWARALASLAQVGLYFDMGAYEEALAPLRSAAVLAADVQGTGSEMLRDARLSVELELAIARGDGAMARSKYAQWVSADVPRDPNAATDRMRAETMARVLFAEGNHRKAAALASDLCAGRVERDAVWYAAALTRVRVHHARGRLDESVGATIILLAALRASTGGPLRARRSRVAVELVRFLASTDCDPELEQRAAETAARLLVFRAVELGRAFHDLADICGESGACYSVMRACRVRLNAVHADLLTHIADAMRACASRGGPTDAVFRGEDGQVLICPRCRSARLASGPWMPVVDFAPTTFEIDVRHGLCPRCFRSAAGV